MIAGLVVEPARYAVTGGIPCGLAHGMRLDYLGTDSGPLDAPQYTPAVGLQADQSGYVIVSVMREGVL